MTKKQALEILRDRLDYYEVVHDSQCGCWKGGHHQNLSRCTCPVGKAFKVLSEAGAGDHSRIANSEQRDCQNADRGPWPTFSPAITAVKVSR